MDVSRTISDFVTMGRNLFYLLRTEREMVSPLEMHILRTQLHVLLTEIVSLELENGLNLRVTTVVDHSKDVTARSISRHEAEFYKDDGSWMESVVPFVKVGLDLYETVIVIATPAHSEALQFALAAEDFCNERLLFHDARELANRFMVKGWPGKSQFLDVLSPLLHEPGCKGRVRILNEMPAMLWDRSGKAAALRLEELWNSAGTLHDYSLMCVYPQSAFRRQEGRVDQLDISKFHRHVHIQ